MIDFIDINNSKPYRDFLKFYEEAHSLKQKNIEAVNISSYNPNNKEISSRYVNLKYISDQKWYFYTNYESPKALDFDCFNQISALFFWQETTSQIRIKANIFKSSKKESDDYFKKRNINKNILATISKQSMELDSYESLRDDFNSFKDNNQILERPDYWGGYYFIPYYFEFWKGDKFRINKRVAYTKKNNDWSSILLYP